jgi:hypothetical protein
MAQNILFSSEFDATRVNFEKAKSQKEGGSTKSSRISYNYDDSGDTEPLLIQTAPMKVPFGIANNEKWIKEGEIANKWDVRLSFQGEERNKKIQRFRKAFEQLEAVVVQKCLDNCTEWLEDDDHDMKTIKKSFTSSIKKQSAKSKEKSGVEYPDMFKTKVPFNKENTEPNNYIKFYDENQQETTWESVVPGCTVVCLVNVSSVWLSPGPGTFGVTSRLSQMQIFPAKRVSGFQIRKETEYGEEEEEEEDEDSIEGGDGEEVVEVESDEE